MEEQVRKEMIQKFEIETEEMKKELTKIHEKEKLELKEGVLQAYAQDLQKILERIEEERKTEKNEIIRNYEDRLEEARLEKRSLEDKILRLEDEKGLMLKQMIEAKEDYHRELENNTKKMHEEMLQMKKALENETLAKLTELKVAASIAQANLVKKHQASMEELLTKHAEELKSLTDHFNELQEASKVVKWWRWM